MVASGVSFRFSLPMPTSTPSFSLLYPRCYRCVVFSPSPHYHQAEAFLLLTILNTLFSFQHISTLPVCLSVLIRFTPFLFYFVIFIQSMLLPIGFAGIPLYISTPCTRRYNFCIFIIRYLSFWRLITSRKVLQASKGKVRAN